jgi:stage V sporulation protein G
MEISAVRLRPASGEGRVRAIASITIDGAFVVNDLRVVDGPSGLFVSMPSRRRASGEYYDIAHPITAAAREQVQHAVLEEYARWRERAAAGTGKAAATR